MKRKVLLSFGMAFCCGALDGHAQTLTINGASAPANGAETEVSLGGDIGVTIEDGGVPGAGYALIVSILANSRDVGWWLEQGGSPPNDVKPIPLVAGVPTMAIESQFTYENGNPVDLRPDRLGSPFWRLDEDGRARHHYRLPPSFPTNVDIHFQAVVDTASGLEVTNGVRVKVVHPTASGIVAVSRGGSVDDKTLGVFSFGHDPETATYDAVPGLPFAVDFLPISLSGVQYLNPSESVANTTRSNIDCKSYLNPAKCIENQDYQRIAIPKGPGADGTWGTADDLPPRDLYRIKDLDNNRYGFVVVNHGENPNTPGRSVFVPQGSLKNDPADPNLDVWEPDVLVSPNADRVLVAFAFINDLDRAQWMAIDGTNPFGGGTSALQDVTPPGELKDVAVNASFIAADKIVVAYSNDWERTNTEKKFFWVPYDSSADPIEIPIDEVSSDRGRQIKIVDEDSVIWSRNRRVMCFVGGTRSTIRDVYAIDTATLPIVARNVSSFQTQNQIRDAGDALDGEDGYMAVSEDGSWVAYCVQRAGERIWVARTDGSMAGGNRPITSTAVFTDSRMNDVRDIEWISDRAMVFYYGDDTGVFEMDLFHYDVISDRLTSLTATGGQATPPFDRLGTIHPEGHFITQDRRHLIFFRNAAPEDQGADPVNVIGVDLKTLALFDLTGSEFSNGWVPSVKGITASGQPRIRDWDVRSGGENGQFYFFRSAFDNGDQLFDQQVFMIDSANPFGAFPLTNVSGGGFYEVLNMTPSRFGPAVAYSGGLDELSQDFHVIDLEAGISRILSDGTGSLAPTADSIRFAAPRGDVPSFLTYCYGDSPVDNPNVDVRLDHFVLDRSGQDPVTISGVSYQEFFRILSAGVAF